MPTTTPQDGLSLCTPGLRLMRHLRLRHKLLLVMLFTWLPLLLAAFLLGAPMLSPLHSQAPAMSAAEAPATTRIYLPTFDALRSVLDARFGTATVPHWVAPAALALVLLAALYLSACAWMSLLHGLDTVRGTASDLALGRLDGGVHDHGSDEIGQALDALGRARAQMLRYRLAAVEGAGLVSRSARELADNHQAMQMGIVEVRAAVGELARRTVALCGMLDATGQDAERANADVDAIQDEELQALQLMATLRARLLALSGACQGLGQAAQTGQTPAADGAPRQIGELVDAAVAHITECHQLSERFASTERANERRVASLRICADGVLRRSERGILEGHQVMGLTRQVEASLAATLQRLEHSAASLGELGAQGEALGHALHSTGPEAGAVAV
jgi:hypothetical protein